MASTPKQALAPDINNLLLPEVCTAKVVGEFIKVDGFYYYSENKNRTWGLWSQEFLESLTIELSKLNKELNDSIDEYFNFQ